MYWINDRAGHDIGLDKGIVRIVACVGMFPIEAKLFSVHKLVRVLIVGLCSYYLLFRLSLVQIVGV